jgi:hypothetical protein
MEAVPVPPEERQIIIEALTLEELEYIARNPEEGMSMVGVFASGGWANASNEVLRKAFQEIQGL